MEKEYLLSDILAYFVVTIIGIILLFILPIFLCLLLFVLTLIIIIMLIYSICFLIIDIFKYLFIPEIIKIQGKIIEIKEEVEPIYIPQNIDSMLLLTYPIQPLMERMFYVIKVLSNNNYYLIRISYKTFNEFKKNLDKKNNSFSRICEKEWINNYYTLVEEN